MQIFAVLGSHPDISLAEIHAVTGSSPSAVAGAGAIFDDMPASPDRLMRVLGGTQKIGYVVGEIEGHATEDLVTFLASQLEHEHHESKMHFGISVYDFGDAAAVGKLAATMKHVGMTVKTQLKERGLSARFVMAKEPALNAVAVQKNALITKGAEFVVLAAKDRLVIGTTAAVQDAEDWSVRDFGRPRRNAKQGMLPPKLARMMLNMSGVELEGKVLLDPFCGSGTILMEGAMLGCGELIGADIASGAVHDTRENLAWLQKTHGVGVPPVELFTSKASELGQHVTPKSVDVLVTETYLGRPRKGTESRAEVEEAIAYIETLYKESFTALRPLLNDDACVVIASPVHLLDGEELQPDVERILTACGYSVDPLSPTPLTYRREGQFVGRRFFRFTAT